MRARPPTGPFEPVVPKPCADVLVLDGAREVGERPVGALDQALERGVDLPPAMGRRLDRLEAEEAFNPLGGPAWGLIPPPLPGNEQLLSRRPTDRTYRKRSLFYLCPQTSRLRLLRWGAISSVPCSSRRRWSSGSADGSLSGGANGASCSHSCRTSTNQRPERASS
jgi:hypothetical protein